MSGREFRAKRLFQSLEGVMTSTSGRAGSVIIDGEMQAALERMLGELEELPVAWVVNGERVTLLGWGAAILLQLAHPLVAAGVAEHSVAVSQPARRVERLRQTIRAMLALTFGDPEAMTRAANGINRIHDRVQGELAEEVGRFPVGTRYSAHDPALLTWVHATLILLLPRAYALFVRPLTEAELARYYQETTWMAPLLGIPDGALPASTEELQNYLEQMLGDGTIAVGPVAHELAQEIVWPRRPWWGWFVRPLTALVTIGLLPPTVRAGYGFGWAPWQERTLRLMGALCRVLMPRLPTALRYWPEGRRAHAIWAVRRVAR